MKHSEKTLVPDQTTLQRLRIDDLPPGATLLSPQDARHMIWGRISRWKPSTEVWSLVHGTGLLAGGAALTGIFTHNAVRQGLRLLHHGRLASYLAVIPIPCIMTALLQSSTVTERILMRSYTCPSCLQIRSTAIQTVTGFAQPIVLSLLTCSVFAKTLHISYVPPITQPLELFKLYRGLLRPHYTTLAGLFLVNMAMAVGITDMQIRQSSVVHEKLAIEPGDQVLK